MPPGWMTFVGHTLMHWPHLMHLLRNSGSASAPGGRITSWCQLPPNLLLSRTAGTAKTPLASESTKPLRETSGFVISPAADGLVWYAINSSLQSFSLFDGSCSSFFLVPR